MELGLGKLLWSPSVFWSATVLELEAAANGLAEFHGIESNGSTMEPLSTSEFIALKEKLGA